MAQVALAVSALGLGPRISLLEVHVQHHIATLGGPTDGRDGPRRTLSCHVE